jgi:NAD(P)-dependent dehydrogenase (short-subunit alcohol dehydrogenase family)
LWGYPLPELMEVCAVGVKRVLDAFVPLVEDDGRVVVVTSGLGPLMHSYAGDEHQTALKSDDCTWDETIAPLIKQCIEAYETTSESRLEERIAAFEKISFPGGPFADSAPDFHIYGLSKMFGDAYMLHVAKNNPQLRVTSVDPGLVYTDLILRMPKYAGKDIGDTKAQTPEEGVEATMRLLFDNEAGKGDGSGKLYAMKDGKLVFSDIDKMPQKQ